MEDSEQRSAGWSFVMRSKRWHFFPAESVISLCKKWIINQRRYSLPEDEEDVCKICRMVRDVQLKRERA